MLVYIGSTPSCPSASHCPAPIYRYISVYIRRYMLVYIGSTPSCPSAFHCSAPTYGIYRYISVVGGIYWYISVVGHLVGERPTTENLFEELGVVCAWPVAAILPALVVVRPHLSRHHTQCHITIQCYIIIHSVTSSYTVSHHHTQCHIIIHSVTSSYTVSLHHTVSHHHTQCHIISVNHHTQCHIIICGPGARAEVGRAP
jgi:hypothetical protein